MNTLFKIPLCYEEGTYLLKDISVPDEIPDSECMILEHEEDVDVISNNINDIRSYQLGILIPERTEIVYRSQYKFRHQGNDNNLDSVCFIYQDNIKLPVFFDYNENIYQSRKNEIVEKIQECIERCSKDLTNALEEIPTPLPPLVIEYYFDSDSRIEIADAIEGNYYLTPQIYTGYLLDCIIKSVPECHRSIIFHSILMSVYNRLCFEIPNKYSLSDDYQLYLPEEYD